VSAVPLRQPQYAAPDGVVIFLIHESVNGTPERRLASKFILDCLRTRQDLPAAFDKLEASALLDIADEARKLALSLQLIA